MSFFQPLSSIGISKSELVNLTDVEIIRIEKRLIAEQKLNDKVSKNDTAQILEVLGKHADVIKEICNLNCFYGILTGQYGEEVDTLPVYDQAQLKRIKLVVCNYLKDELLSFINININANNWNNLRILLYYHSFFDNEIFKILTHRLQGKIEYAFTVLNKRPKHDVLRQKIGYISNSEFYNLLALVNKKYFVKYIMELIAFISKNAGYVGKTSFFAEMVSAFYTYDRENKALTTAIQWAFLGSRAGKPKPLTNILLFLGFIFFVIIVYKNTSTSNSEPNYSGQMETISRHPQNKDSLIEKYAKQADEFQKQADTDTENKNFYVIDNQKMDMRYFVMAHQLTLSNPSAIIKLTNKHWLKYQNPFSLKIFEKDNEKIKVGNDKMELINKTDKECIAIAYYPNYTNIYKQHNQQFKRDVFLKIHALYVPPHDSILVAFKMDLLRFYIGRNLASFNSTKGQLFKDSLDARFSTFTAADSMLFSKAFLFKNNYLHTKKVPKLTISQSSANNYKIRWVGDIHESLKTNSLVFELSRTLTDTAVHNYTLLLNLKNRVGSQHNLKNEVNTFLNYADF